MFKPFDLFYEKKFPNEENAESLEEATKEWNTLENKKKLKFIKKAEKKYDSSLEENPDTPPFHTFLSSRELDILMKSYGLPDKLPANSKLYYIKKKQDEAQNNIQDDQRLDEVLKNSRIEAENEFKNFTEAEKNALLDEYHLKTEEFNDKFFVFARSIPENRIVDYKEFTKRKPEPIPKEKVVKPPQITKKRENAKELHKKFTPFDVFLEKHREDFDSTDNLKARNEARSKFKDLNDKKRLKYVKKAETNYDEYYKNSNEERPLFSTYLNKNELKLLLESYGMPDSVPNFTAYYYRLKTQEGMMGMKEVFDSLKKLPADDKEKLQKEHTSKYQEYLIKNKQFLDSLPLSRLEDYNFSKSKQARKSGNSTTMGSPSKKLKKSKDNGKSADEILSLDESD
ncbi:unnamed protein product [Brachionus calyciflorus]|uniref:Uncharacterized protein n=1 Tax=Brachionus calyciflorus TaxID=104777 RepID=A0A813ZEQ2_9BILA|nr:unnamed protein product [Brachionus calyciflorus]